MIVENATSKNVQVRLKSHRNPFPMIFDTKQFLTIKILWSFLIITLFYFNVQSKSNEINNFRPSWILERKFHKSFAYYSCTLILLIPLPWFALRAKILTNIWTLFCLKYFLFTEWLSWKFIHKSLKLLYNTYLRKDH